MGKIRQDLTADIIKERDALRVGHKAAATKIHKLEQQLNARELEVEKLKKQIAGAPKDDSAAVQQLKEEARQLRAKVLTLTTEATVQGKLVEQLKKERDNALVQLTKPPIERLAAAPPAQ